MESTINTSSVVSFRTLAVTSIRAMTINKAIPRSGRFRASVLNALDSVLEGWMPPSELGDMDERG